MEHISILYETRMLLMHGLKNNMLCVWFCTLIACQSATGPARTSPDISSGSENQEAPIRARGHSVPLLEGDAAPFSGVLFDEDRTIQAIEDAAEVDRLRVHVSAITRLNDTSTSLYEGHISNLNDELRTSRNWNKFSFPVGLVLGLALGLLSAWGIYSSSTP